MKVTLGKKGLTKTWQGEFPETTKCCKCEKLARIGFVAHEGLPDDGAEFKQWWEENGHKYGLEVARQHGAAADAWEEATKGVGFICEHIPTEESGLWLHDCCAVAVYFCRGCLKPTALYSQG